MVSETIDPEKKQDRAKQLRYKKSVAEGFNIEGIRSDLYEIQEACDNIRYCFEGDEAALIDALDGDEDEAYELRMLFSDLAAEADTLDSIIHSGDYVECFDDFFAAVAHGSIQIIGFDSYEEDYYKMTSFEQQWGSEEAKNRIMRMKKQEIIAAARQCFGIAAAILNIRYKYDYLSASFDILKSENASYLQVIKNIEDAYNNADKDKWGLYEESVKVFERLVDALPARAWLE